jgi:hypothetical protein
MADELPTGTVTFLFTDIEGSTKLLQRVGEEGTTSNGRRRAISIPSLLAQKVVG